MRLPRKVPVEGVLVDALTDVQSWNVIETSFSPAVSFRGSRQTRTADTSR